MEVIDVMSEPMNVVYDPLDKFTKTYTPATIVRQCQIIKNWAVTAVLMQVPIRTVINEHYGYAPPLMGGKIDVDGTYRYPNDPDLYPLCVINSTREKVYFYEYEILAIRNSETNEVLTIRVD